MKNIIKEEYMPVRATQWSAGYDLYVTEPVTLCPGTYKTLDTGVVFEEKDRMFGILGLNTIENEVKKFKAILVQNCEYVGLVFPRSSYGFKYGLRFGNSICVIDQDYRDTIKLSVTVDKEVTLEAGDRIAQIVFIPWLMLGDEQPPINTRNGGIGSTGN